MESTSSLRVAVLGAGYWGKNMLRVIAESPETDLVLVCDRDAKAAQAAASRYSCEFTLTSDDVFARDDIDAVYIATPPATHAALARRAMETGKHVLVEKPITDSSADAVALSELAQTCERTLMVGHTFLYSPPVVKVKELITNGTIGDVFYIDSQRINLGKYQDSGVLWDLAPHDLSIILYWLGETPIAVKSSGRSFRSAGREDVVFLTLEFPSGAIANLHMSWLAPVKLRRTMVSGSQRMVVYDDTAGPEAIKVFNQGVDRSAPTSFGEFQLSYRQGDTWLPRLDTAEPLQEEWKHFVDCVRSGRTPRSAADQGILTVAIIEACERALKSGARELIEFGTRRATPRPRFGIVPDPAEVTTTI